MYIIEDDSLVLSIIMIIIKIVHKSTHIKIEIRKYRKREKCIKTNAMQYTYKLKIKSLINVLH